MFAALPYSFRLNEYNLNQLGLVRSHAGPSPCLESGQIHRLRCVAQTGVCRSVARQLIDSELFMAKAAIHSSSKKPSLPKAPTGIEGLDEITGGGLPRGRPTLVCGSAGCGKTLLGDGVPRSAAPPQFGEPGVFIAFEETAEELAQNVRSLGFDLDDWPRRRSCRRLRPRRAQRDRGDGRVRPGRAVHSPRATPSTPSAPSASCSTPSRRSSAACPTPPSSARNCAACSAGSRIRA